MKNALHLLLAGATCLLLCSFLSSCQQIQNASAQEKAVATGDGDPSAFARALVEPEEKPSADTPPSPPKRNDFGFSAVNKPVQPIKREIVSTNPKPAIKETVKKKVAKVPEKIAPPKPPTYTSPRIDQPTLKPSAPQIPTVASSDPKLVKLGIAQKIPGDNLHVILPGEYANLGRISVEKVDPAGNTLGSPWTTGTQMQIPNPNVAGGRIYFKVP